MSIESDMIHVEVVYALPQEQRVFNLVVNNQATVEDIIRQSGVLELYPEIDLKKNKVGVYSRNVRLDATVRDKDRIEITAHYWQIQKRFVVNERSKQKPLVVQTL